jgi:glycosyltransferase involved in cell wall biosynthesis
VVLFGGELTKGYRRRLEDLIEQYNLTDKIFVKGNTEKVYEELIQSDIFAFPSIHEEGFPLALTEAMATGLPCIGIETTLASQFLIAEAEAGLVSANTVEDFAKKLSLLMKDDGYRRALGKNARVSMEKYSSDRVCQQWEKLMISAIQSD